MVKVMRLASCVVLGVDMVHVNPYFLRILSSQDPTPWTVQSWRLEGSSAAGGELALADHHVSTLPSKIRLHGAVAKRRPHGVMISLFMC